ncbi:DNA polymerase III subunit gamma/tau, partial [Paenibacillus sepulcri]|nr:DNA polymerase III subunit gamma/tau [Paenibacillus sepulcri]
ETLERRLEQLLRTGVQPAGEESKGTAAEAAGSSQTRGGRGAAFGNRGGAASPSGGTVRSNVKLEPFLAAAEGQAIAQVRMKWSEILQRVKEMRITVH